MLLFFQKKEEEIKPAEMTSCGAMQSRTRSSHFIARHLALQLQGFCSQHHFPYTQHVLINKLTQHPDSLALDSWDSWYLRDEP